MGVARTPKQHEILTVLLGDKTSRPEFDPALASELRDLLERDLADVAVDLTPRDRLVVGKHDLQHVHACEGLYQAKLYDHFEWTVQNTRGRIVHRGVQRQIVSNYAYEPLDLAEQALVQFLEEDDGYGPGEFLRGLDAGAREDLVGAAGDALTKFLMDWPPIRRSWRPRVESAAGALLCGGRIELRGRVDLTLGAPEGTRANVFIVDFKTGREHDHHIQDARFYALIETLSRGAPPYRVATYYLDSGTYRSEDVTADVLEVARRRTVAGVRAIHRVRRDPASRAEVRPNPLCRFCPALGDCEPGQGFTARDNGEAHVDELEDA
jgi:hypothetical protein